uniref:17-beta hydroxysteroid dehydrogenase n=1 Tax=Phallusia mammillata TaxID=59560 RepID=A0A6F9DE32_9ASCI|nr:17-beta hydroxysteroid dehydrogenase [Phallusia mammillata]
MALDLPLPKKLAAKGQNIVLISRNAEKLSSVATELREKHNVETKEIAVDFSKTDIYEKIGAEIKGLDVGTLINNVGVSYDFPDWFLNFGENPDAIGRMMAINVNSVVKMVQLVMPTMVAKKRGIILNLSSGSAIQPTPLLSLYSASKQFVDCFSKCLDSEYGGEGIIIQSIVPLYVTTKMSKIRRPSFFVPTPDKFVSCTLKTIGSSRRSYGYFAHAIQGKLFEMVPESLFLWAGKRMSIGIRAKSLKKRDQAAKGK